MTNKMELLKQIVATEFMKDDLALYLNTHPMDREAIAKYNYYVMESKGLKESYEMNYGMLSEHDSLSLIHGSGQIIHGLGKMKLISNLKRRVCNLCGHTINSYNIQ